MFFNGVFPFGKNATPTVKWKQMVKWPFSINPHQTLCKNILKKNFFDLYYTDHIDDCGTVRYSCFVLLYYSTGLCRKR